MSSSPKTNLSVLRVTPSTVKNLTSFLQSQRPIGFGELGWSRWIEKLQVELTGEAPQRRLRTAYLATRRDYDFLKETVSLVPFACAVGKRKEYGFVRFKAVLTNSQISDEEVAWALPMLLDKIAADCYKDDYSSIEFTCLRGTPACSFLISRTSFEIRHHGISRDVSREEITFGRRLAPLYTGDPKDWKGWCEWFLRDILLTGPFVERRVEELTFFDWAHTAISSSLLAEHGVDWKMSAVAIQEGEINQRIDRADLVLTRMHQHHTSRPTVSLESMLEMQRKLYLSERQGLFLLGEQSQDILNRVFEARYRVPAEQHSEGLLVDITHENLTKLIQKYASMLEDVDRPEVVYFMGAPIGKNVREGQLLVLYCWDSPEGGCVKAIATVVSAHECHWDAAWQPGDEGRSTFESQAQAQDYFSRKQKVLRVAVTHLSTSETAPIKYGKICEVVLGLREDELAGRETVLFQLFPNEDVGHTYLSAGQCEQIREAGHFAPVSAAQNSGAWEPSPEIMAMVGEQSGWIDQKYEVFRNFLPSGDRQITRDTIERSLLSAAGVGGRKGVDALKWVVEHVDFFDRKRIEDSFTDLRSLLAAEAGTTRFQYCPVGGIQDSGNFLVFPFSVNKEVNPRPLGETLNTLMQTPSAEPIVLFDDIVASGKQIVDVVRQWLGRFDELELKEDHVVPLDPAEQVVFLLHHTYVAVLMGPESDSGLRNNLSSLLPGFQGVLMGKRLSRDNFGAINVENAQRMAAGEAKVFFESVGQALIADKNKESNNPKEPAAHALGYGNSSQLVVFGHNVPTCTLTGLWCEGTVNSVPWFPMFPRKRSTKPRTTVLPEPMYLELSDVSAILGRIRNYLYNHAQMHGVLDVGSVWNEFEGDCSTIASGRVNRYDAGGIFAERWLSHLRGLGVTLEGLR